MIGVIEFDVRTPCDDRITANVEDALKRQIAHAEPEPDKTGVLTIIANGPTAAHADWSGDTLALNGAIRLGKPTYWAGCDPQPIVAGFLTDPPKETTYYVASKCHPSVFDVLDTRDVRLWHIGDSHPDGVPTACSITLTAMSLFRMMGWRRFRTWGWDGCYIDGKHHASDQPHDGADITVMVDGIPFRTTTTWACEAQDACNQLEQADYEVEVMGGGMIGAVLRARGIVGRRAPSDNVSTFQRV